MNEDNENGTHYWSDIRDSTQWLCDTEFILKPGEDKTHDLINGLKGYS